MHRIIPVHVQETAAPVIAVLKENRNVFNARLQLMLHAIPEIIPDTIPGNPSKTLLRIVPYNAFHGSLCVRNQSGINMVNGMALVVIVPDITVTKFLAININIIQTQSAGRRSYGR